MLLNLFANLFLLINVLVASQPQQTVDPVEKTDKIKVYIFLLDECKICHHYSLSLTELYNTYQSEQIEFIGLFPNFVSQPKEISKFKKNYKIPFPLKTDYYKSKAKKFGVTVTPEVVVYNETKDEVLYKGRIDNSYFKLGKQRSHTTKHELKDALHAITSGEEIAVKETQSVGCFINFNEN
jgi:peroxiredoxin